MQAHLSKPWRLFKTLLAASLIAAPLASGQAAYPDKPITVIVPFAPGGPSSILARLLTDELAKPETKQRFIEYGAIALGSTPAELRAHVATEIQKWDQLIKSVGITVQ